MKPKVALVLNQVTYCNHGAPPCLFHSEVKTCKEVLNSLLHGDTYFMLTWNHLEKAKNTHCNQLKNHVGYHANHEHNILNHPISWWAAHFSWPWAEASPWASAIGTRAVPRPRHWWSWIQRPHVFVCLFFFLNSIYMVIWLSYLW